MEGRKKKKNNNKKKNDEGPTGVSHRDSTAKLVSTLLRVIKAARKLLLKD